MKEYTSTSARYNDDEISLIDLAATIIKHWKLATITFGIFTLVALVYIFNHSNVYKYSTIYNTAYGIPTLETDVLANKLNLLYIPEQLENKENNLNLNAESDGSAIIKITSNSQTKNKNLVKKIHTKLIDNITVEENIQIKKYTSILKKQLKTTQNNIKSSLASSDQSVTIHLTSVESDLISEINNIEAGRLAKMTMKSLKPVGITKRLMLIILLPLGSILAISSAFIAEFVSEVRKRLHEEKVANTYQGHNG